MSPANPLTQFRNDILHDVANMIRSAMSGLTFAIASQKDATLLSDGHRILNFQGPGVAVANDPTMRRTNVFIPGSPSAATATVIHTDATTKAKTLWNGSSNDAPPAGWETVAFSDSAWSAAAVHGGDSVWPTASPLSATEWALFRHHFTLPAGQIVSASIAFNMNDASGGVWINGTFLTGSTHAGPSGWALTLPVDITLLNAGAANLFAAIGENTSQTGVADAGFIAYLTVNMATAGTDSQYELVARKGAANGYCELDAGGLVPTDDLGTGTASGSTFLRGDQTWAAASTNSVTVQELDGTPTVAAITIEFPNGTLTDHGGGVVEYVPASPATESYANVQCQRASGTSDGTFTSGAWQTRTLNTIQTDTASIVSSLASNQITLAAGTYRCRILCPAYNCNAHQSRLQNITDSTTVLTGTTHGAFSASETISEISGKFTLSGTKALAVQHQCQTTQAANGFGPAASFGTEVYTVVELWKIS